MNAIDKLHLDFPFKGSRQLCRVLVRQGYTVGRLHVRSLLRKMGIAALAHRVAVTLEAVHALEALHEAVSTLLMSRITFK